jgi:hypothetical protein
VAGAMRTDWRNTNLSLQNVELVALTQMQKPRINQLEKAKRPDTSFDKAKMQSQYQCIEARRR